MPMVTLPARTRVYRHHHLDSTRWDAFRPREGDIVIATSYKAGTTWTQAIVGNLLFPGQSFPAPIWQLSPWLDGRGRPLEQVIGGLEAQPHRRFIKSHLALDGLPYFPEVKYIFVSRDGRDVALSLWNHYRNYTDETFERVNSPEDRHGAALPPPPETFARFWRDWCRRGWFEWESDGWPFWSHLRVTQSWWAHRGLPNVLVLHYADMKRNPSRQIRRIAGFLGIDLTPERLSEVAAATSFDAMRRRGADYVPRAGEGWKGGVETFLHKGVSGQWRGILSDDDLALYDAACTRALEDDCRAWMDAGEGG